MTFVEKLNSLIGQSVIIVAREKLDKMSGRDEGTLEEVNEDFIVINVYDKKHNVPFEQIVSVAET